MSRLHDLARRIVTGSLASLSVASTSDAAPTLDAAPPAPDVAPAPPMDADFDAAQPDAAQATSSLSPEPRDRRGDRAAGSMYGAEAKSWLHRSISCRSPAK